MSEDPLRSRPVIGRLFLILVAGPIAILTAMYGVSLISGIAFGDLVFALTGLTAVAWFVSTSSLAGSFPIITTRRIGQMFGSEKAYVEQISRGKLRHVADPSVILFTLTVTVVFGWILIVVAIYRFS